LACNTSHVFVAVAAPGSRGGTGTLNYPLEVGGLTVHSVSNSKVQILGDSVTVFKLITHNLAPAKSRMQCLEQASKRNPQRVTR